MHYLSCLFFSIAAIVNAYSRRHVIELLTLSASHRLVTIIDEYRAHDSRTKKMLLKFSLVADA